jgi:ribonuclease P protein component
MNTTRETFNKSERLCSRKIIETLFENGNVFYNSLFKVVWIIAPDIIPSQAQVAFSVSKRGFRLAVTRNLIKRRMREVYRKNKKILYEHLSSENIHIAFIVIVRGNKVPDYVSIEKSIIEVINKLIILTIRKTLDGSQKTEVRRRKSEDGSQKTEVRRRKSEDGSQKTEV